MFAWVERALFESSLGPSFCYSSDVSLLKLEPGLAWPTHLKLSPVFLGVSMFSTVLSVAKTGVFPAVFLLVAASVVLAIEEFTSGFLGVDCL